jgi:hypothetical protein
MDLYDHGGDSAMAIQLVPAEESAAEPKENPIHVKEDKEDEMQCGWDGS